MCPESTPRTRPALLANGTDVPLDDAARAYALLRGLVGTPDGEWDLLFPLRQLCLGRPVEDGPAEGLARIGVLNADGSVPPTTAAVVLSAVRGDGRALHVSSPFVDTEDRLLAEYLIARDELPQPLLDRVAATDPRLAFQAALEQTTVPPGLQARLNEILGPRPTPPDGPPSESPPPARPR